MPMHQDPLLVAQLWRHEIYGSTRDCQDQGTNLGLRKRLLVACEKWWEFPRQPTNAWLHCCYSFRRQWLWSVIPDSVTTISCGHQAETVYQSIFLETPADWKQLVSTYQTPRRHSLWFMSRNRINMTVADVSVPHNTLPQPTIGVKRM